MLERSKGSVKVAYRGRDHGNLSKRGLALSAVVPKAGEHLASHTPSTTLEPI